jgi:O-antigen/teichoic acid export membrane protein
MTATVVLLAPALVVTILDETWLPATGVVAILSISRAIGFFGALLEPTLMTTGRARQQFAIRLYGAGALLVLLFIFARYGAEAAAYAHVASSVLVAVLALAAMMRALELRLGQLVATFVPGAGLTILICAAILGTEAPRAALGTGAGLAASLVAVAVAWLAVMVLFLRRRVLVLPTP